MPSSSLLPQVASVAIEGDRDRTDKAKRSPPTMPTARTSSMTATVGNKRTAEPPSPSPPPPPSLMLPPLRLTSFTHRGGGGGSSSRRRPMMVILSLLAAAVAVGCASRFRGPMLRRRREDVEVSKTTTLGARAKIATERDVAPAASVIDVEDEGSDYSSSPPPGYPWNDLFAEENDTMKSRRPRTVDVGLLLSRFDDLTSSPGGGHNHPRLDVSSDGRGSQSVPYLIHGGRLYCPSYNLLDARTFDWFGYWYRDRIRPFQEMVSEALRLGGELSVGRERNRRFERVVGGDVVLPIILDFADYRGCSNPRVVRGDDDGAWPRFTFAREAASAPAPAGGGVEDIQLEGCGIPFAVPGYDTWLRHKDTKLSPSDWDLVFRKQEERYPWNSKLPVAVWRGSTTGDISTKDATWRDLPRARLVKFGLDNPDLLDAAFTKILQRSKEEAKEIGRESRVVAGGNMPFDDFMKYKVVVDIDGNSWSSRFGPLLCTNSVVLKVEPTYTEYFYSELTPWKHYVPVRADMSDLISTIEYATSDANEKRIRGIVRNANDWCRYKMTRRRMALDMLWILVSYAELLDESVVGGGGGGHDGGDGVVDGDSRWRERWEEWTSEQRLRTSSSSTHMVPVGDPDASRGEWRNELPYVLVRSLLARITTTTMTRRPSSSSTWLVPLLLVALVAMSLALTMSGTWSSIAFRGRRRGTVARSRHVHQS